MVFLHVYIRFVFNDSNLLHTTKRNIPIREISSGQVYGPQIIICPSAILLQNHRMNVQTPERMTVITNFRKGVAV